MFSDNDTLLPQQALSPLGVNIRKYREQNRITQQAFADACGISISTLKRILAGQTNLSLDTAIRMADVLHISLDELVGRAAPRPADDSPSTHELLAVLRSHLEEKQQQIEDHNTTIRFLRQSNRIYQIVLIAALIAALAFIVIDVTNGHFGYIRYSVPALIDSARSILHF